MAAPADRGPLEELRDLAAEAFSRVRNEASRLGESGEATVARVARELGLATREELEELELRLAQLEHRLRLLEKG